MHMPQSVLVGLVGKGIQLSRSPLMHEVEGEAQGLHYVYRLLDTDSMGASAPELADILRFADLFGFSGLNITYPYKQQIVPLLDALSDDARSVGSVNTVVFRGSRRVGHNTDMWGFRESFRRSMTGADLARVLLVGAGGAGAAVGSALLELGVEELCVFDTEATRADQLARSLSDRYGGRTRAVPEMAMAGQLSGLVNATPVGMASRPGNPVPEDFLQPRMWVADIVYFPLETELLKAAAAIGCRILGGQGMAVLQAARAFELFTGKRADEERMRKAFTAFEQRPTTGTTKEI
jgi:shikimate dehydrogenase